MRLGSVITTAMLLLAGVQSGFAVTPGQVDDFEDGTTMGWAEGLISPNPPVNVPDGGPTGAGDNFVRNDAAGGFGPGGRMIMFNRVQWTGDFVAAGVTVVTAYMANLGATPLSMRIAIQANLGERYASTSAVSVPADGLWYPVSFGLTPADLSLVGGAALVEDVLANVTEFRILSAAAGPSWLGDEISSAIGVDNITAVPPTPALSTLGLVMMVMLIVAMSSVVIRRQTRAA